MKKKIKQIPSKLNELVKRIFLRKRKRKLGAEVRTPLGWLPCRAKIIESDKIWVTRFGRFIGIFDYDERYVEYVKRKPTIFLDIANSKPFDYRTARSFQAFKDEHGRVVLETGINPAIPRLQREFGLNYLTSKFLKPKLTSIFVVILIVLMGIGMINQWVGTQSLKKETVELKEKVTELVEKTAPGVGCCSPCLSAYPQLLSILKACGESCRVPE
jgi:hypothetical protein